jgi:hypothetical protein
MSDRYIPIIIGVTGHLDLKDEDRIEGAIDEIIRGMQKRFPASPIKILSPLAEGADRLVAKVGIQTGAQLWAVLPMPRGNYEDDFDEESKAIFWDLLGQSEAVFELPLLPGNTKENIKEYEAPRNSQYAAVGAYVASHCNILIAIWNGTDTGQEGGTADVVRYHLEGVPEKFTGPRNLLEAVDNGPVYHVFAARSKKQTEITSKQERPSVACLLEQSPDGQWDILYPKGWTMGMETLMAEEAKERIKAARSYYDKALDTINAYNQEISTAGYLSFAGEAQSRVYLFNGLDRQTVDDFSQTLSPGLNELLHYYSAIDNIACSRQSQTVKNLRRVILTAFSAFMIWSIYSAIWPQTYALLLFVAMLAVTYMIKKRADTEKIESRYYDYRALAEALRTQFFWKYLGLKDNVYEAYSSKYRGEVGWIQHAIKAASMKIDLDIQRDQFNGFTTKQVEFVKKHWIDGQAAYFKKGITKREQKIKLNANYTHFLLWAWGFVIVGFFALKVSATFENPGGVDFLSMADVKDWKVYNFLEIGFDFFLAAIAAWATYLEKRGVEDELKQFQRMKLIFAQAQTMLEGALQADDLNMANRLFIETGREAIAENGDWLLMQRSRPMEVPLG